MKDTRKTLRFITLCTAIVLLIVCLATTLTACNFWRELFRDKRPSEIIASKLSDFELSEDNKTITGIVNKDVTVINVPREITAIGNEAFKYCRKLKTVSIPSSVTSIGVSAFKCCDKLVSITIPNSVTDIAERAFDECTSLEEVSFSNRLKTIGAYAFGSCDLQNIIIPDSVTSIGMFAFNKCTNLTTVVLSENLSKIAGATFMECSKLTSIVIPESVTEIEMIAFGGCDKLASVTFKGSSTIVLDGAFAFCPSITSLTIEKEGGKYYTDGNCIILRESKALILGCKTSVIPTDGSVTSIGPAAFVASTSLSNLFKVNIVDGGLTSISIPDGVTHINSTAFMWCYSLSSITIPNSVQRFGKDLFSGCKALTEITFKGTKDEWIAISKKEDWNSGMYVKTIHCTDGDLSLEDLDEEVSED